MYYLQRTFSFSRSSNCTYLLYYIQLTFNLFHTPGFRTVSNSFLFFFVSFYTFYTLYSHFIFMLISSDREIYHSPLIRIQNRRRVFCAGFVYLEAMQAWHGFLFKIPRDCSVFYTLAIPTHIRISWCFATLLCSCVCGALILSAMHMQAWHGFRIVPLVSYNSSPRSAGCGFRGIH